MKSVKFGFADEVDYNTNSALINSFFPINNHEYLTSTRNGLFRFEGETIKKIYPYKLATSLLIPEYKFIAGISSLGGELVVFLVDEIETPILSKFKTDQLNVFHMIYSHKSHSLITVGAGIKVWNFNVKMPRKITLLNKPEITITLRAQIAPEYDTPILNPPSIDYDQEILYLPKSNGFGGYDLDGKERKLLSKVESTPQTAASLCQENKKFLTAYQGDGFHLWSQKGYLIKRIPGVMSSVLALRFINKHFALFVDSNFWVFIIDIKTSNFFHCMTISSKPSYFNVYRSGSTGKYFLVVGQGCVARKLEIVLPWVVWKKMTTQPYSIRRCPKFNEAARILTYFKSSIFSFLSPKDGKSLTSAVDTQPSGPIFHFYDRGLLIEPIFDATNSFVDHTNVVEISKEKRDVLFVTTAEANTSLFSTGNNPCQLVKIIEIQVSSITVCEVNGVFMYCFSNSQGELLFYRYDDFSRESRKLILKKPIKNVFYHRKSGSIIIVFDDEVHLFDLKSFKDVQRIPFKEGGISEFYGNLLLIGCKSGKIESFRINQNKLKHITDDCIHYHDDKITSFGFSPSFFISSSLDKTLKVWNYNFNLLYEVEFPFPLFSSEILNAERDLLVGTDNEILKIKGSSLFGFDNNDREMPEIDNYDKISDELTNQLIQFAVEKNKNEESDFFSSRMRNQDENGENEIKEPSTKNQRRRRFNFNNDTDENFEAPETQKNNQNNNPAELTEEERNRRLYEMNLINERSDNEKLQAKLRAEMKMKMAEEERKRKLKEAEEARKRKLREEEEEEEEDKVEVKAKKKRKRKIVKNQKVAESQPANEPQKDQIEYDDFDFLKKPKKKEETTENENLYQRKKSKKDYQLKKSNRPSRPFRTNGKNGKSKKNGDDEYDYYEEDEYDQNNGNDEADQTKLGINQNNSKKESNENEGNEISNDGENGEEGDFNKNDDDINASGANEDDDKFHDGDEGQEANQENGTENEDGGNSSNLKEGQRKNGKAKGSGNGEDDSDEDGYFYEYYSDEEEGTIKRKKRKKSKFSKKLTKAEIDTQTSFSLDDDEYEIDPETGQKIRKKTVISKQADKSDTNNKNKLSKKANNNNQESNSESKGGKKKHAGKHKKTGKTKGGKDSNAAEDSETAKSKANEGKEGKKRTKLEQIVLKENIKRSPTPPPQKKILYPKYVPGSLNCISNYGKTSTPSKPRLKLPVYKTPRRCRTPPVLPQEKLIILPGPEVVLDREAIVDRILDGEVELMPLLRRMNVNNRSLFIQILEKRENNKNGSPKNEVEVKKPPQFHNVQFTFPSLDGETDQKNPSDNKFASYGQFYNSYQKGGEFNRGDYVSMQLSYPPQNQPLSCIGPFLPSNENLNSHSNQFNFFRKNYSQKVKVDEIAPFRNNQNDSRINPLNRPGAFQNQNQPREQKVAKKKNPQQVSILNLDFDLETPPPEPSYTYDPKRQIAMLRSNNFNISPRRNQLFQRRQMQEENNCYVVPVPKDQKQRSPYQKFFVGRNRSSSPPIVFRPKFIDKPKFMPHTRRNNQ